MKRVITSLLALLAVASCTKESIESYPSSGEVTFTTKASVTRANEKNTWSGGDKIGIYAGTEYTNLQYNATIDGSTVNFTPEGDAVGYTSQSTPTTFYAYYPFKADATTTSVPFDLAALTDGLLKQEDMLWSSATSTKSDNDASVELQFDHVHSIIEITVAKGADLSVADFNELEVELSGSYTKGNLNITSGETTGTVSESFNLVDYAVSDNIYTMSGIVMAHDYDADNKGITLTFSVGKDAATRTFAETLSPKWEAGRKYRYVAKVGYDDITFIAGSITAWGDDVSDDVVATSGYDIVIKTDDVFEIYTAKGLAAFRDLVMGLTDNSDAKIDSNSSTDDLFNGTPKLTINGKLMNDINLASGSWTPIGSDDNKYNGTFDGNGHEVQKLCIDAATANQGLFGYNIGTIQKLGVRGSVNSTGDNVGGLVGYNTGKIDLCYSNVAVSGANQTGGLVGQNSQGQIINSYNIGSVSSTGDKVGGLVGLNESNNAIANCCNMGNVSSTGSNVGGVIGEGGNLNNCYSAATVSGSGYVGGVVGYKNSTVTNCYYNTNYFGGLGSGYPTNHDTGITPSSSQEMKYEMFVTTLNNGAYTYDNNGNLGLKAWKLGDDGYPLIDYEAAPTFADLVYVAVYNSKTCYIFTTKGLKAFADYVNSGSSTSGAVAVDVPTFSGAQTTLNGKLMCDITLEDEWTPINKYYGTFDGNNKTVTGLSIKNGSTDNQGFFGSISRAVIKNLTICGDVISEAKNVGGIVGTATYSTITNCVSDVVVSGGEDVGGVVGRAEDTTLKQCGNKNDVTGTKEERIYICGVGGVAGITINITLIDCYNIGDVSGTDNKYYDHDDSQYGQHIGGVVGVVDGHGGSECYLYSVYNTGNLTDSSRNCEIGGVVGYMRSEGSIEITNSYNSGDFLGYITGGLVGENFPRSDDRQLDDCYYYKWKPLAKYYIGSEENLNAENVDSKSSDDMKQTDFVDLINQNLNSQSGGYVYAPGSYPKLKWEK